MNVWIGFVIWWNLEGVPVHAQALGASSSEAACLSSTAQTMLKPENKAQVEKMLESQWSPELLCVPVAAPKPKVKI
jgi:hypothetical protein